MTNHYDFEGKTVDDAIADGLIKLGLSRDQVDIEVLHKGSRGIFGIGSEPAVVRLVPRSLSMAQDGGDEPASAVSDEAATEGDLSDGSESNADESETVAPATEESAPVESVAEEPVAESVPEIDEADDTSADEAPSDDSADEEYADVDADELVSLSTELLHTMLRLMGFEVQITAEWREAEDEQEEACLMLDVEGENLGPLIGRHGETLANIQYLLRLMINQRIREWRNIVVDVAHYKARRADQLTQLALRMADQVVTTGRALSLEPMPSNERRVVHMALRDHPDVYTQSTGEADRRKVNIFPRHD